MRVEHSSVTRSPVLRAAAAADASYVLQLRRAPNPSVTIELHVTAGAPLLVVGCDDGWAGVERCEDEIGVVHARDEEGHELAVRQSKKDWSIATSPGERVTIDYVLSPSKPDAMAEERTRYYPVVADRYMPHRSRRPPRAARAEGLRGSRTEHRDPLARLR
jgi:hypothetical protein